MTIKLPVCAAVTALVLGAAPAAAQETESWTGPYAGVRIGYAFQPEDDNETVLFDTNMDGTFGDTVNTAAGANAFSPGFCGGAAGTALPSAGCGDDKDGYDVSGHIGFDYQIGAIVVGVVGEYGRSNIRDDVTAFSTTPANYVLTRRLRDNGAIRARAGFAFGNTLAYATGGIAYGKIRNSFRTTNVTNFFATNGGDEVYGYRVGGGLEHRLGRNFSIGALYTYTSLKDDDFRVRVTRGFSAATNPFILANANGTDFARSGEKFTTHSATVTASFRF